MDCPICGKQNLHRISIESNIYIRYGPYRCPCGWSSEKRYDVCNGPKFNGKFKLDQWGGATYNVNSWPETKPSTLE